MSVDFVGNIIYCNNHKNIRRYVFSSLILNFKLTIHLHDYFIVYLNNLSIIIYSEEIQFPI